MTALQKACPSQTRPAGTPPSTFLFLPIHLSNSPGPCGPTLQVLESGRSPRPPIWDRKPGHCLSEELRRRAVAPRRWRAGGRYIGAPAAPCQHPGGKNDGKNQPDRCRQATARFFSNMGGLDRVERAGSAVVGPYFSASLGSAVGEVSIRGESRRRHGNLLWREIQGVRRYPTIVQKACGHGR